MSRQYFSLSMVVFLGCSFSIVSIASGASASNSGGWESVFADNSSTIIPLFSFGNKNYYLGNQVKSSYIQAVQICKTMHMDLISIKSKEENDFIHQYLSHNTANNEYFTAGSVLLDGKNWIWMSNGEPVYYTNWKPGQPDNLVKRCLSVFQVKNQGLLWSDEDCNAKLYFLCERYKGGSEKKTQDTTVSLWPNLFRNPTLSPNIPLLHFNGKSYYIGNVRKFRFLEATQFCQMIQMQLATITSREETTALFNYLRSTRAGGHFWTSGTKIIDGRTWIWFSTGQTMNYTNWIYGRPDHPNKELCIEVVKQDGSLMWNDLSCDELLYFICENSSNGNNQPTRQSCCQSDSAKKNQGTNSSTGGLPVTYVYGKRYLISTTKVNYYEASELCYGYGMELLSITNIEKNDVVSKLLANKSSDSLYWTSGNQMSDAKTWTWSNGDPITYHNWKAGEPNNLRNIEHCIDIHQNGEWNDQECEYDAYFICEDVDTQQCCD